MNLESLDVYRVGGAVRDKLLGIEPREHDWVVIGSSPEEMKRLGFTQVGKDFPVFLNPQTKEEYALARTERKSGHGYHGFSFDFSPDVSLEEDLSRRDLTINAMAMDSEGTLIDPYGGRKDLENRRLKHVSQAFGEDPLRVLRVARFAARFDHLGFQIDPSTLELMGKIVNSGELEHLSAERIWTESDRALAGPKPSRFFQCLRDCGALRRIYPEVDQLFGVPQTEKHHPEIDTGVHTLLSLDVAEKLTPDPCLRFAVLVHDLGKGVTPEEILPRHVGHEKAGVPLVEALCSRLAVPNRYRKLATLVCRYHLLCHQAMHLRGQTLYKLFSALDLWRNAGRLDDFLICCEADARGRKGLMDSEYPAAGYLKKAWQEVSSLDVSSLSLQFKGKQIGDEIERCRINFLNQFRKQHGR